MTCEEVAQSACVYTVDEEDQHSRGIAVNRNGHSHTSDQLRSTIQLRLALATSVYTAVIV